MFFSRFAICLALFCTGCVTADLPDRGAHRHYAVSKELELKLDRGQPLTREEIVRLSRDGMAADEIIAHVRRSGSAYRLGQNEQGALLEQGIDPAVVDYLASMASIPKLKYGRGSAATVRGASISGGRMDSPTEVPAPGAPGHVVTQRPDVVGQSIVTGQ